MATVRIYARNAHWLGKTHPSENHAVLKYRSTSTLSDFAQILCKVT